MEIRAGGKIWEVETQQAEGFCGVTFRDPADRDQRVAIGWVPARGRITSAAARRLFELAGERLWKDPRTGVVHRVLLEDGPDQIGGPVLSVRFATGAGAGSTLYDLEVPLGMASDEALERLLDRALRRGPARWGPD